MSTMTRAHRLAAIMFTDIQGYTKLMGESEDRAIRFRDRHREIFQSSTERNRGEIIQYYGDGTLSIFESCVDAVRCAVEMQELFQSDPVIPVRIGIHLGDIVMSEQDIIGDSVNVASRVESLGIPGCVLISGKVYDEIRNKQEFEFHPLGTFHFKNDRSPRRVYAITGEKLIIPRKNQLQGKLESRNWTQYLKLPILVALSVLTLVLILFGKEIIEVVNGNQIETLAVLPLNDRIGLSPDESYIIEGLHEEIIVRLGHIGLNVKPYSVMTHYRDTDKSLELLGQELDVDALVEGSVFRSGDQYRIRLQIIEVDNQEYLDDPYEAQAQFASIMSLYSDLVETIAHQIEHSLSDDVQEYLDRDQEVDPQAYDLYLKGRSALNKGSEKDIEEAIGFFNQTLAIDSTFVDAHVSLIESYLFLGFTNEDPSEQLENFRNHLAMAIDKDPFFKEDHHLMAMVRIFENWDWNGAIKELKQAMSDAPDSWEPFDSYCQLMWAVGDMEKSIWAGEQAVKKGPDAHFAHCDLAWAYYFGRDYEQANYKVQETIERFGSECPHHAALEVLLEIEAKVQIGQSLVTVIDRLEKEINVDESNPIYNSTLLAYAYAIDGNREKALGFLSEIDSTDTPGVGKIYVALGDYDTAFERLNQSVMDRSLVQMFVIKQAPWYDPLRDDPRFQQILTRMGLADHQLD